MNFPQKIIPRSSSSLACNFASMFRATNYPIAYCPTLPTRSSMYYITETGESKSKKNTRGNCLVWSFIRNAKSLKF